MKTRQNTAQPLIWNIQRALNFARLWAFLLGVVISQLITRYTESVVAWDFIQLVWSALLILAMLNLAHYLINRAIYQRHQRTRAAMLKRAQQQTQPKKGLLRRR